MRHQERTSSGIKPTGRHVDAHLMHSESDWAEWWDQRLSGWRANHTRAVICELAYDLGVPPTAANIFRACKTQLELHELAHGFDLEAHAFDPYLKRVYEQARDRILATQWSVPSGPNKWSRALNAERPLGKNTWNQIKIISQSAATLARDPVWPVYREQPTHRVDYRNYCKYLYELFPNHPECFRPGRATSFQPPPLELVAQEFEADNLRSLRYFLLLKGAANSGDASRDGWPAHHSLAYDRTMDILSRLSCIPPFATFGEEFAIDVMGLALDVPGPVLHDWQNELLRRRNKYNTFIKIAYENGVLVKDSQYPQGQRWQELELMRFFDAEPFEKAHAALTVHKPGQRESPLCVKFQRNMSKKHAPILP